jgi:hypothetical protein
MACKPTKQQQQQQQKRMSVLLMLATVIRTVSCNRAIGFTFSHPSRIKINIFYIFWLIKGFCFKVYMVFFTDLRKESSFLTKK